MIAFRLHVGQKFDLYLKQFSCYSLSLALRAPVKLGMGTFGSSIKNNSQAPSALFLFFWKMVTRSVHDYYWIRRHGHEQAQKRGQFLIDSHKVQAQKSDGNLLRAKPVKRFPLEQCSLEKLDGRPETA